MRIWFEPERKQQRSFEAGAEVRRIIYVSSALENEAELSETTAKDMYFQESREEAAAQATEPRNVLHVMQHHNRSGLQSAWLRHSKISHMVTA